MAHFGSEIELNEEQRDVILDLLHKAAASKVSNGDKPPRIAQAAAFLQGKRAEGEDVERLLSGSCAGIAKEFRESFREDKPGPDASKQYFQGIAIVLGLKDPSKYQHFRDKMGATLKSQGQFQTKDEKIGKHIDWLRAQVDANKPEQPIKGRQTAEYLSSSHSGANGFLAKNTILYGPPGTGKTYSTVAYSVAMVEGKNPNEVLAEDYKVVRERYRKYLAEGRIEFITFHQSYGYEEFIEGIRPVLEQQDGTPGGLEYELSDGAFKKFCEPLQDSAEGESSKKLNRVFIIDEINRGNVSKIFGELITLIEDSKRIGADEETRVKLPYSGELFGVPEDVYILGTMNTADRSLAVLDTALRRRFDFIELMPQPKVLADVEVDGINVGDLLKVMNKRITLLHDREHMIGHAFFIPLIANKDMQVLAGVMRNKVLPLLQEYFYEDYEKIRQVLGDSQKKKSETEFVLEQEPEDKLLGSGWGDIGSFYEINDSAFEDPAAYAFLGAQSDNEPGEKTDEADV